MCKQRGKKNATYHAGDLWKITRPVDLEVNVVYRMVGKEPLRLDDAAHGV